MLQILGFYSPEWWRKINSDPNEQDTHDCTSKQIEEAIQGYFTADALPLSLSGTPGISGKVCNQITIALNVIPIRKMSTSVLKSLSA